MQDNRTDDFKSTLKQWQSQVEQAIDRLLPGADVRPGVLHEAMRYSMKAGGKRLRPVLVMAGQKLFPNVNDPLPAAVAIECLHTYTLIHDDLPCMDDSDLRRGKPTCHKQFDEETALLAGDSLLTYAFYLLAQAYGEKTPGIAIGLVKDLSDAAGSQKLIGGQMEDLLGERTRDRTPEKLDYIHHNKTAELIMAALVMGVRLTGAGQEALSKAAEIGKHMGLAFQVIDDILDATSDAATLGKPVGNDEKLHKLTYVSLYGLEESRKRAHELSERAVKAAEELGGDNAFLIDLIRSMEKRVS